MIRSQRKLLVLRAEEGPICFHDIFCPVSYPSLKNSGYVLRRIHIPVMHRSTDRALPLPDPQGQLRPLPQAVGTGFGGRIPAVDDPIASDQGARELVLEISALVAHLLMLTGQPAARFLSPAATSLGSCVVSLQLLQAPFPFDQITRVGYGA
jgi:hypothetical protein